MPVLADSLDEANETVIVTLSNSFNNFFTDDDATPSLSIADVSGNETAGNRQFTVTLSAASGQDVTVNYATSNGTATAGADYTATSGSLTIAAGATTATFNVGVLADSIDEANETATLTLSSASNASISDATATLTITDDDATPSVDFNATSSNGAESASSKALTVDLSAASGRDVTVDYAITGTATGSGTDFTLANGTLTISAGDTSGTITIASIINDTLDEANETVIVTLSSPGNATLGSDKTHTYTINDNDATPSLSINDVSGNETAGNRQFTVTLSAASGLAVTVNYATSDGTATAGADYTAISATQLTIAAGATTATFNVGVLADSLDEANETVTLTLSSASSSASISDATGTLTITDDDATPSLSIADVSGNETAGNRQFTVTLSAAAGRAVTVNYATSDGTATAGADYTAISATQLTIAAGATTATFNVGVLADSIDEANETATLTLSGVSSTATISDATATLTITDDDATPSVDFNATSSNGAESASSKALTVDLSAASGLDVTVDYAITGTATGSGTDFTLANGTLTISAGDTSGTITIASIINDTLDEANETVIVTLSSPGNATLGSDKTHTYTINDNDATPSLSINDVSGNETAGNRQFTVTLSAASGLAVTVNYATSDGTATAGADYTAISATQLTIAAGATTATFNVGVLADSLDEANETVTLTLSSASSSASISDATGTLTITDDDATPSLSIADVSGNETAGNRQFTVTLSAAAGRAVTVNYATSDGTATAGADYTAISATQLTIAAGATTATFNVGVLADSIDEANETATLTLSGVSSTATISDATATLTITDDDATPSVDFNATSSNGAESASSKALTVDLSAASGLDVTVDYAITGTATGSGTDFTLANGTLTISAGDTSGTITIASIINDTLDEANETVIVTLSSPGNATLGSDKTHTYTINDNDATPSLSINDVSGNETAGNRQFTVTLSAASGLAVTVNYATSDGTATAGADYTAISATQLTIAAGATTATFNVGVLADSLDEANETVTLTLSSASSSASISDATGTLTITDDDATPSLSIADVSGNETAGNRQFTVTLSAAAGRAVTVNYATSDGTATAGADYTATNGTLTIAAGATTATFNVGVLADSLDEANETVTLTLSSATNASISDATATLTISDDDNPPTVDFTATSSNGSESVSSKALTVDLSAASGLDVTVDYAITGTATGSGTDFTLANGTLTISAGDTSGTITIASIVNDSLRRE